MKTIFKKRAVRPLVSRIPPGATHFIHHQVTRIQTRIADRLNRWEKTWSPRQKKAGLLIYLLTVSIGWSALLYQGLFHSSLSRGATFLREQIVPPIPAHLTDSIRLQRERVIEKRLRMLPDTLSSPPLK